MSERGGFFVDRGVWDHPVLASSDPFSRREAWLWLVSEAAWRGKRVRLAGATVTLNRGQVSHSIRFLAEKWGWRKSTVQRFVNRLKTDTMIGTEIGTGILIITICNYDKYQVGCESSGTAYGTANGTGAGQERDKANKGNKEIKESIHQNITPAHPSAAVPPVCDLKLVNGGRASPDAEFDAWWKIYPRHVSKGQARKAYRAARKKLGQDALLAAAKKAAATFAGKDQQYIPHPATWLNGERWSDEDSRKTATDPWGNSVADWRSVL